MQITQSAIAVYAIMTNDTKTLGTVFQNGKITINFEGMNANQAQTVLDACKKFLENLNKNK